MRHLPKLCKWENSRAAVGQGRFSSAAADGSGSFEARKRKDLTAAERGRSHLAMLSCLTCIHAISLVRHAHAPLAWLTSLACRLGWEHRKHGLQDALAAMRMIMPRCCSPRPAEVSSAAMGCGSPYLPGACRCLVRPAWARSLHCLCSEGKCWSLQQSLCPHASTEQVASPGRRACTAVRTLQG
jgi:hypothetical protein